MGASGSMVGNRDRNIEMNIADEAKSGNTRAMKRHSSQPSGGAIFSSLKPRTRLHEGSIHQSASLKSSGSFDPSSASIIIPSEAVERVRKEYETLKCTKEQEIQALHTKAQKFETENHKLRAEVQALNKQYQKLRLERDAAVENSQETTERAIALEQDREKIQRQFKIFRETKESEIQALLQAKRQLESKFHTMEAHGVATIDDHNYATTSINANAGSNDTPGKTWWAPPPDGDAHSLFGHNPNLQTSYSTSLQEEEHQVNIPGFPHRDAWSVGTLPSSNILPISYNTQSYGRSLLKCYISYTPDEISLVKNLLSHPTILDLQSHCLKEGYCLSLLHFTDLDEYRMMSSDDHEVNQRSDVVRFAVSSSSLFVAFLGSTLGRFTETEYDEGYFDPSNTKSTFFCIKENTSKSSSAHLRHRVLNNSHCRSASYASTNEATEIAVAEISKAVRLEFGIKLTENETDSCEVLCLDELILNEGVEQLQHELCAQSDNIQPIGLEKCYDRLDEVVSAPGPIPPLLISGTSASGKSLLLSSWMKRVQINHPDLLVIHHFVTGSSTADCSPVIMIRRLLSQLLVHLPIVTQPPVHSYTTFDVGRLRDTLPRWLEQLSTKRNMRIVLVVDSIDLVKDADRHFRWVLDPLHVGVRVIISVGVDTCPDEWRQLPTLHLEPLTLQSVRSLLQTQLAQKGAEITQNREREVVTHCRTASTCHPLYVTLLSVLVSSVSQGQLPDGLFNSCMKTRDSVELYRVLIRELEAQCGSRQLKNQMKSVLQFITCSKDGLSECEILSLLPDLTWYNLCTISKELTKFFILKQQGGLLIAHNSEISTVLYDLYVGDDAHEKRCRKKLLSWIQRYHDNVTSPRSSDLLLWLLGKEEERQMLQKILINPTVFHLFYTRGHANEVVSFWNFLNEEKVSIASKYRKELKKMESVNGISMTDVAKIYESLGRFMKDVGLLEEAVFALQRSLEIQETILDPDHPSVSNTLHHLAAVYTQWGKYQTAEPLYRQALEIVECAVGRDHLRVAQELCALVFISRKVGHLEAAESLQQRVASITKRNGTIASNEMDRMRRRALRLEELSVCEDSIEVAQALNDLGVIYHMHNNLGNAESFFQRSLKMRQKLHGHNHLDVAQSLHNLAATMSDLKNFEQAAECMMGALEIRRSHLHKHDPVYVNSLRHMGMLYKKMNDHANACDNYKELLSIAEETTGVGSVTTAAALVNLAVSECQNKNLTSALPLYEQALDIYRDTLGPNAPETKQTLRNIAVLLYQKGDLTEAAAYYKRSMPTNGETPRW